jgi:two-component system phosphate regulon sensor histidine kinase PhoR
MRRLLIALTLISLCLWIGHALSAKAGMVAGAFLAFGIWVALEDWQARRLESWLGTGKQPVPRLSGHWDELHYRMYQRLRRVEAEVKAERDKLERFLLAIQASPNGVALLDHEYKIEWCNAQLAAHLGLNAERDRLQRITFLVRHPDFLQYLNSGVFSEPLILSTPGGGQAVQVQLFPFSEPGAAGDHLSTLLLTRDVTEQERTDTMRRDFVANVSHELKTPLTVLKGFLETVQALPLGVDERERFLMLMSEQADRMQSLVDDLLVLAKLESDRRAPEATQLDMRVIVDTLRAQAEALSKGQHEITASAEAVPLVGSQTELISAFSNLVTNAVRYTPPGGQISISWRRTPDGAELVVRDTGMGIAPEHISRLTERFYRVDRARSRDTGGTGLGLAIVKHALQRHGAELRIDSKEGVGSTFKAVFPAQRLSSGAPREQFQTESA